VGPSFVAGEEEEKFVESMVDMTRAEQGDAVLNWCKSEESGSWLLICNTTNYSTGVSIPGVKGCMCITPVDTTSEYMQLWGRVNRFCYDVDNSKYYKIKQLFVTYGNQKEYVDEKIANLKKLVTFYNGINSNEFVKAMSGTTIPYKFLKIEGNIS